MENSTQAFKAMVARVDRNLLLSSAMPYRISQFIAGSTALCAFAVAVLAGLTADVPTAQVLVRALVAMLVCYLIGWGAGAACQYVIASHLREQERAAHLNTTSSTERAERGASAEHEEPIVV